MTIVVQQFVGHYLRNMQWEVVSLLGKAYFDDDWQNRTYDVRYFNNGANVGSRSKNGTVVLDDDFPTSGVACADDFLPSTGRSTGDRRSRAPNASSSAQELTETVTLTDIDGTHLVQLRVGCKIWPLHLSIQTPRSV